MSSLQKRRVLFEYQQSDIAVVENSFLLGYENCNFRSPLKGLMLLRYIKKITLLPAVFSGLDTGCQTKRGQEVRTQVTVL